MAQNWPGGCRPCLLYGTVWLGPLFSHSRLSQRSRRVGLAWGLGFPSAHCHSAPCSHQNNSHVVDPHRPIQHPSQRPVCRSGHCPDAPVEAPAHALAEAPAEAPSDAPATAPTPLRARMRRRGLRRWSWTTLRCVCSSTLCRGGFLGLGGSPNLHRPTPPALTGCIAESEEGEDQAIDEGPGEVWPSMQLSPDAASSLCPSNSEC
jgi:hypothetical protein